MEVLQPPQQFDYGGFGQRSGVDSEPIEQAAVDVRRPKARHVLDDRQRLGRGRVQQVGRSDQRIEEDDAVVEVFEDQPLARRNAPARVR